MRRHFFTSVLLCLSLTSLAQKDTTAFRGYLENRDLEVYLRINFYDNDIMVPGQDFYGAVPGFLGKVNNPFCWIVVDATVKSDKEARLSLINDYGSEDLTATLVRKNDSLYVLQQGAGSSIKVPRNGKWFKLPKTIEFIRRWSK